MRLTAINFIGRKKPYKVFKIQGNNQLRYAKYQWELGRRRRTMSTGDREHLLSLGVEVCAATDVVSAPYETPKYEDFFPTPEPQKYVQKRLHRVGTEMLPLLAKCTDLMQRLCWTVMSDNLPQSFTERQRPLSHGEKQQVEECILSCHLLDGVLDPLPLLDNYELPNKLEKPLRQDMPYGIPIQRKNELLTCSLLEMFDHSGLDPLQLFSRPHLPDVSLVCNTRHLGELVQFWLPSAQVVCRYGEPLGAVVSPRDSDLFVPPEVDEKTKRMILRKQVKEETGGPLQQPLPDNGPMLPFIGSEVLEEYDHLPTQYVTSNSAVAPHTVHLHHNAAALDSAYSVGLNTHQLTALTMVNLYAHALTYAVTSAAKIDAAGHLEKPIVVQGIHSHASMFQPAVFQLNTIGPNCHPLLNTRHFDREASEEASPASPVNKMAAALPQLDENKMAAGSGVRNVFFYRPFDKMYLSCEYDEVAKPSLKAVNYDLVSLLRAIHES